MRIRKILEIVLSALVGAIVAFLVFLFLFNTRASNIYNPPSDKNPDTAAVSLFKTSGRHIDLSAAAESSVETVVHVKTIYQKDEYENSSDDLYDFLFGASRRRRQSAPTMGSGSGVIVTSDGYIVTNNHVVAGASEILVSLYDKRNFEAELIGQDPVTDLALLKIKAEALPILKFGDSDDLKLGQWVLAVGNPFNLTSTVTAGIISAKARDIGLSKENRMSIESFLQTDAAVNPGNSGGALVNAYGELIGINTAIESRTGSYTGYSFAIPVSIVKKVVGDLIKYKKVQRAFIGISIVGVNSQIAQEYSLDKIEGVFVSSVVAEGAADMSGIKASDVILSINSKAVNTNPQFLEQLSKYKPGDKVEFMVLRNAKEKLIEVLLRNINGDINLIDNKNSTFLGSTFKTLSEKDKYSLKINSGLKIVSISEGKLKSIGIKKGFIIYKINNKTIHSIEDIKKIVEEDKNQGIFISGVYPNGNVRYYAFSMVN